MIGKTDDEIRLGLDGEIHSRDSKPRRFHSLMIVAVAIIVFLIAGAAWYLYLHREQKLTEKDSILIAEFTNKAGNPVFEQALRQGVSAQLGQSPFFRIVSSDLIVQTLHSMDKSPYVHLTPEITRKVCQRINAKAMIAGSISAADSKYIVSLEAVNCRTGEIFAKEQAQTETLSPKSTAEVRDAQILDALAKAALLLRSKLGESKASIDALHKARPSAQITSSSLAALQAYDTAEAAAVVSSDWDMAISQLESAIALDPEFAKAYVLLGTVQMQKGQDQEAKDNLKKAYELRNRVSDFESQAISMIYYRDCLGDYEKALQIVQRWNQDYPRHALPLLSMGDMYLNRLGRFKEALDPLQETLKIEPQALSYRNAIVACLELNRLDDAKAIVKEAWERKIDRDYMQYILYVIAFRQNDKNGMAANAAEGRRRLEWGSFDVRQDIYKGRLSSMRDNLRRKITQPANVIRNSRLLALAGFLDEAKTAANTLDAIPLSRDGEGNLAVTLALSGDTKGAQKLAEGLTQRFSEATSTRFCYLPAVQAALALRDGKPQQAIENLVPSQSYESVKGSEMITAYLRGAAYLAAQQGAQAAAEFQKMIDRPSIDLYDVPRNILPRLGLARACAMQGDKAKARTAYQEFLTLWKDADPDIPILKQAKDEYRLLQ
jgi:eukaryotic-like serine/threonine-protein kinase